MAQKNVWIGLILSIFVTGLGNVYNGLYKRFVVELVIRIIIMAASMSIQGILGLIIHIIGALWQIYCIYDTYNCTLAINKGVSIPLLLGNIDLE